MDNGKINSAAYLLKPHGNFPLSIINFQVPQSLPYTTSVSPLLPLLQPKSFRYRRTNAWQNNLRFQSKDHARFQLLLHAWSQHRHFIDFQSDAMTDKLGFLSGSHKVVGKAALVTISIARL